MADRRGLQEERQDGVSAVRPSPIQMDLHRMASLWRISLIHMAARSLPMCFEADLTQVTQSALYFAGYLCEQRRNLVGECVQ